MAFNVRRGEKLIMREEKKLMRKPIRIFDKLSEIFYTF